MRLLTLGLLIAAFMHGSRCVAQSVALDAFWHGDPPSYDKPLDSPLQLEIVIQLTNTGKERLTVLCRRANLHFMESNHSDPTLDALAVYRISYPTGIRGIRVIPSVTELMPVTLEPGESTEFRCPVRISAKNTLEKIRFHYWIDEDIGRRFGAWFGDITAPVKRQRMGYPPRK